MVNCISIHILACFYYLSYCAFITLSYVYYLAIYFIITTLLLSLLSSYTCHYAAYLIPQILQSACYLHTNYILY